MVESSTLVYVCFLQCQELWLQRGDRCGRGRVPLPRECEDLLPISIHAKKSPKNQSSILHHAYTTLVSNY